MPPGNVQRGRQIAERKYAACHGADGNGVSMLPLYPKLAGQNPSYLYRQILVFESGARTSDVMAPMIAGLSDADLAGILTLVAQKNKNLTPGAGVRFSVVAGECNHLELLFRAAA